jgi:hypothetical protein
MAVVLCDALTGPPRLPLPGDVRREEDPVERSNYACDVDADGVTMHLLGATDGDRGRGSRRHH